MYDDTRRDGDQPSVVETVEQAESSQAEEQSGSETSHNPQSHDDGVSSSFEPPEPYGSRPDTGDDFNVFESPEDEDESSGSQGDADLAAALGITSMVTERPPREERSRSVSEARVDEILDEADSSGAEKSSAESFIDEPQPIEESSDARFELDADEGEASVESDSSEAATNAEESDDGEAAAPTRKRRRGSRRRGGTRRKTIKAKKAAHRSNSGPASGKSTKSDDDAPPEDTGTSSGKRSMLINVSHAEESRVVILRQGIMETFEIETDFQKSRKGDILMGRVESIQPGLQAAFVNIGDERSAFLPLDEVSFKIHPSRKDGGRGRIENHLKRGQEILVQIVRDAFATKPPTLSTYFSLPGRYMVLTPFAESAGISRKLDDKQRDRLRKIIDDLKVPEPHGVIARTAAASATKLELQRDLRYLMRLWDRIQQAANSVSAPSLVYKERSLVIRALRDLFTPDIDEILVDDVTTYEEIQQFLTAIAPHKRKLAKLYEGQRPLFNKFNLEEQIENIFRRRVPLPSGGAVIFDSTEALTAVDVNSSKMKKEGHIEDTATKANVEAAQEIARQLRLRDQGGLIVIDFIDMRSSKNVRLVEKTLRDAMKPDKARYDMTRMSRLGLVEISRERLNPQKSSLRYQDCPQCYGTGSIKTIEAAAMKALRKLQTRVVRGDLDRIEVIVGPDVAEYMLNVKRTEIDQWETRYRTQIRVLADPSYTRDDIEMTTSVREEKIGTEPVVLPVAHGEILKSLEHEPFDEDEDEDEEDAEDAAEASGSESEDDAGSAERKRRRRRRRGGKKHRRRREAARARAMAAGETESEVDSGQSDASTIEGETFEPPIAAPLVDVNGDEAVSVVGDGPRLHWWKRLLGKGE